MNWNPTVSQAAIVVVFSDLFLICTPAKKDKLTCIAHLNLHQMLLFDSFAEHPCTSKFFKSLVAP